MKISEKGLLLIASFEGLELAAYQDSVGVWTIGYGCTVFPGGKPVKKGDTVTKQDALELLRLQADEHAATIEKYIRIKLTQDQFDALASFQYNLGKYILSKDRTLTTLIHNRAWLKVAERMKSYNKAGGRVLPGLVKRRNAEATLFLLGVGYYPSQTTMLKLKVDGHWGPATTKALQRFFAVSETGIIHGQTLNDITRNVKGVEFSRGGSNLIRLLQKYIGGVTADGYLGHKTIIRLQTFLNVTQDGVIPSLSEVVKRLQTYLNTTI